nr:restriction endonuclease subunit S [uncultured Undibacterium sp.]
MNTRTVPFLDVFEDESSGNIKTPQSEYLSMGKYPIVDQGKVLIAGYVDDESRICGNGRPAIIFGDHTRCVKYVDFPFCIGADGVKVIRPKIEANLKYLYYFLNQLEIQNAGYDRHYKYLKRTEVVLQPLAEQNRIAAILDQADVLRIKRREALVQLDSLTQSIFVEMFGEISTNSNGWMTCTVGDVSDCIVPGRDKPKSFSGNIPWVTTADLNHLELTYGSSKQIGLNETEIKEVRARVIPSGSVIISCVGDLGIVSIANTQMVINQQLHSFQCHSNMNNVFLMYCLALQKPFMLAKASSTTLPYMNKTVCNSIPVIVPPVLLQQTFAARIQLIETIKSKHRLALTYLDNLFASLNHRAFRGEL